MRTYTVVLIDKWAETIAGNNIHLGQHTQESVSGFSITVLEKKYVPVWIFSSTFAHFMLKSGFHVLKMKCCLAGVTVYKEETTTKFIVLINITIQAQAW